MNLRHGGSNPPSVWSLVRCAWLICWTVTMRFALMVMARSTIAVVLSIPAPCNGFKCSVVPKNRFACGRMRLRISMKSWRVMRTNAVSTFQRKKQFRRGVCLRICAQNCEAADSNCARSITSGVKRVSMFWKRMG